MCAGYQLNLCYIQKEEEKGHNPPPNVRGPELPTDQAQTPPQPGRALGKAHTTKVETDKESELFLGEYRHHLRGFTNTLSQGHRQTNPSPEQIPSAGKLNLLIHIPAPT